LVLAPSPVYSCVTRFLARTHLQHHTSSQITHTHGDVQRSQIAECHLFLPPSGYEPGIALPHSAYPQFPSIFIDEAPQHRKPPRLPSGNWQLALMPTAITADACIQLSSCCQRHLAVTTPQGKGLAIAHRQPSNLAQQPTPNIWHLHQIHQRF